MEEFNRETIIEQYQLQPGAKQIPYTVVKIPVSIAAESMGFNMGIVRTTEARTQAFEKSFLDGGWSSRLSGLVILEETDEVMEKWEEFKGNLTLFGVWAFENFDILSWIVVDGAHRTQLGKEKFPTGKGIHNCLCDGCMT